MESVRMKRSTETEGAQSNPLTSDTEALLAGSVDRQEGGGVTGLPGGVIENH